jgi:drug/metabolite transporter (DMT)-like permease
VTWAALALVVVAAFVHASWNYVLKKSGGGIGLLAASAAFAALAWAPIVLVFVLIQGYRFEPIHLLFMLGSALVHTAYYLLLDRAYRSGGDLSIVYPLARATGPLLTIVVAVLLLGERPGAFAIGGALLIGASALLLTGNPFAWHRSDARHAIGFALLTGLTIAAYTVWDKAAVAMWLIPPLVYDWGCIALRFAMLVPLARRRAPGAMHTAWRERRTAVVIIGALSPLSYILVLIAMVFTPVSLVAPAREVSILFAALMGSHLLREGDFARRAVAAVGMVLGISGLALG